MNHWTIVFFITSIYKPGSLKLPDWVYQTVRAASTWNLLYCKYAIVSICNTTQAHHRHLSCTAIVKNIYCTTNFEKQNDSWKVAPSSNSGYQDQYFLGSFHQVHAQKPSTSTNEPWPRGMPGRYEIDRVLIKCGFRLERLVATNPTEVFLSKMTNI